MMYSQERLAPRQTTLPAQQDTIATASSDSLALSSDSTRSKQMGLESPVAYQAMDSMVITAGNKAFLYGESNVQYQQIELQAENIEMNLDSSLVYARFGRDSIGDEFGYPLFKDGDQEYESKTMQYNFRSKKGYITDVITQQGEGFVTAGRTKKMDNDVLNMAGGKYTTCDEHEHPHFYIQMTKAKVRPQKSIVTGPVYLVVEDVPLYPLGLPFCFFPFTDTYSSGVIMPTYQDDSQRGFGLRDGGYYFAINDYIDLSLTGEIYTKGSWGLQAQSTYRKRYKFSGNFNLAYQVSKLGDKGLSDYSLTKDFRINWTHTQDAKANPYRTFSASVNFQTSSFDRNSAMGIYNPNTTSNTKGSSINITQRFPNSPLTLSATMNVNQSSRDSMISVTLPNLSITMSRIYPFKRKNPVGKERWYEKISMSYSGYFRNSISTKENQLLKSNLIKDWNNSMEHSIPINATFTAFKYINITPSFNYKESWYTSKITKEFDPVQNMIVNRDTTYGFYRIYNYNASISASTTLYGFFKPLPFLGDKVQMIRHRLEPSVSLSAAPDFGSSIFGFYDNYRYIDANGNTVDYVYSPFAHNGTIPSGKQGSLNFSINNNVEMKVKSDKDSTGFRKISLIDKLSLGISYNMVADSFKWSDLSAGLRLKLSKSYTLNLNGQFDTYTYGVDKNGNAVRRNITRLQAGKGFGRLRSTGTSFSYTFSNETFKKWFGKDKDGETPKTGEEDTDGMNPEGMNEEGTEGEGKTEGGRLRGGKKKSIGEYDADGYMITNVPWSLSFNYSLQLRYGDFDPNKLEYKYKLTHALSFNGSLQPTKNWSFNFNATYDFDNNKISFMTCNVTRNLHCFRMSASFVPVGPYKSYTFSVAVSSSLLKDLKYNQSSSTREGQSWY